MKVCPRCSYVDAEGHRVCLACRRSLMGAPDVELAEVLAQRELALVGDEVDGVRAPWGPAITEMVDHVRPGLDEMSMPAPTSLPVASRTSVDASVFGDEHSDVPHFVTAGRAEAPAAPGPPPAPPRAGVASIAPAEELGREVDPDDIAEATRQQLARMYDARLAAPVLLDVETATNAPRPPSPAEPREPRPPSPRRKRVALAVVLLVVAFFGVRYVRDTLAGQGDAIAQDPATPVGRLPWHFVDAGSLRIEMPVKVSTDSSSGTNVFRTYELPDVSITLVARDAVPGLSTEVALRSYATQVATQLGGRVTSGVARDATFGTTFSAQLDLGSGSSLLYVVSTGSEVVEVRADLADASSGRATSVFERIIRSVAPR